MLPASVVLLVNADFETRAPDLGGHDQRAIEADAAVLDTARSIGAALGRLAISHSELRVTASLDGVPQALLARAPDVVFNLVESIDNDYGREWEVPVMLAQAGFAYTGNGARPLRTCRCKDEARTLLQAASVRVADALIVNDARALDPRAVRFPVFVKPARVDGSIGIDARSLCTDMSALRSKLESLAGHLPGPFLVEQYLPGKELNVSLFPAKGRAHVVVTEIDFTPVPAAFPRFVTYDSKWNPESPEYASCSVPARIDDALMADVTAQAQRAFRALDGEGYGRVDLRLDPSGLAHVIDVNPNNDLHEEAGLARAAASIGVDYDTLIAGILQNALQRRPSHRRA